MGVETKTTARSHPAKAKGRGRRQACRGAGSANLLQILVITSMAGISCLAADQSTSAKELTYITEQYPPYNYQNDGKQQGISVDLLEKVWQKMGADLDRSAIKFLPWTDGYQMTLSENNLISLPFSANSLRSPAISFSAFIALASCRASVWVASALFGGMAAAVYNERVVKPEDERKRNAQDLLENFLIPAKFLLEKTENISTEIVDKLGGDGYFDLERSPRELEEMASRLPDDDLLKYNWNERIFRLHDLNRYISNIINKNSGKIKDDKFREACIAFLSHAGSWEDMYKGIERYQVDENAKISNVN
jgi:hypothetical protein